MKFIDAVKAMGPGQLLIDPYGGQLVIIDGLFTNWGNVLSELGHIDEDGWTLIGKPRPRVKFADAMRAALDGKVIKSYMGFAYKIKDGSLVEESRGKSLKVLGRELNGYWEIIEPEGDK